MHRRRPLRLARAALLAASLVLAMLTITAPTVAAQSSTAAREGWGYGFQVQMWHFNQDAKQQVVSNVTQAGFNWMTHQVEWSAVEVAPGQFDFSELDGIVNTGAAAGLKVMLSVAHAPEFYRSPTSGLMPGDPATFQQFMNVLATQYAGKVQAYEIWNEENLEREAGFGNVDPITYLPLLENGYTGVKSADPTALVLLGAPSPTGADIPGSVIDDLSYLQQLYAINGGEVIGFFDALSAHPSGFSNPPDCTPDTPQCSLSGAWNDDPSFFAFYRVGQYRDTMVQNNDAGKQIWLTEFGYCSNTDPPPGYEYCKYITEDQQALFLKQSFELARQTPYIGAMFQWNLNFQMAIPQTDEKWGFSVVRSDWSGRPAYGALLGMPKP
jgi:hypothetical protein